MFPSWWHCWDLLDGWEHLSSIDDIKPYWLLGDRACLEVGHRETVPLRNHLLLPVSPFLLSFTSCLFVCLLLPLLFLGLIIKAPNIILRVLLPINKLTCLAKIIITRYIKLMLILLCISRYLNDKIFFPRNLMLFLHVKTQVN